MRTTFFRPVTGLVLTLSVLSTQLPTSVFSLGESAAFPAVGPFQAMQEEDAPPPETVTQSFKRLQTSAAIYNYVLAETSGLVVRECRAYASQSVLQKESRVEATLVAACGTLGGISILAERGGRTEVLRLAAWGALVALGVVGAVVFGQDDELTIDLFDSKKTVLKRVVITDIPRDLIPSFATRLGQHLNAAIMD